MQKQSSNSSAYTMATGGQKRIDGSTAKNAVAKAARPLRALLANHRNIEVLVQSELLKQNEPQENVIRAIKERVEHDPQMFWILLDKVSSFSNCEEAVKRLRGKSTNYDLYYFECHTAFCLQLTLMQGIKIRNKLKISQTQSENLGIKLVNGRQITIGTRVTLALTTTITD